MASVQQMHHVAFRHQSSTGFQREVRAPCVRGAIERRAAGSER